MFDKNQKVNRLTLKNMLFVITYTVALVWIVLHVDEVIGMLWRIIGLLKPFIYGIMMAFVFNLPMKFYLKKLPDSLKKAKRPCAALLALLTIGAVIAFIFQIVVPTVIDSITSLASAFPGYLEDVLEYFGELAKNGKIAEGIWDIIDTYSLQLQEALVNFVRNGLPQLLTMASGLASGVANLVLSIVIAVYLIISKDKLIAQLKKFIFAFTSEKINAYLLKVGRLTNVTFSNFVTGQLVEALIIGILCYVGCLVLRFPYAPILSVIIGCTNIIPIFGAIIGVVLSALLVAFVDPLQGVFFVIFGIVLQQIESNLIYPRVVGNTVGLSGLWVLFAITIGGGLFSFAGMLLGLPVFSVIYSLLREAMNRRAWEKEKRLDIRAAAQAVSAQEENLSAASVGKTTENDG